MSIREITILKGSPWEDFGPAGSLLKIERTNPRHIHPTKGYRECSIPAGTNRRRRLIKGLASSFTGSHEANRRERSGGRWAPVRG